MLNVCLFSFACPPVGDTKSPRRKNGRRRRREWSDRTWTEQEVYQDAPDLIQHEPHKDIILF